MKKSVLTAAFAALGIAALQAQAQPYDLVVTTEPYLTLDSAIVLSEEDVWDLGEASAPVGFPFHFDDAIVDEFYILGYTGALITELETSPGTDAIFGYGAYELAPASGTSVRYQTVGAAPARIFKIEWYKCGFSDSQGQVSFQIWLHEMNDVIQIRTGPASIDQPVNAFYNGHSPLMGLMIDYAETFDGYEIGYSHWIDGPATAPGDTILYDYEGEDQPPFGCNAAPAENLVLSFYPAGVLSSAGPAAVEHISVFPNPATDRLYFSDPLDAACTVRIYDATGRPVLDRQLEAGATSLEFPAAMPAGHYLLQRSGNKTIGSTRFVKG